MNPRTTFVLVVLLMVVAGYFFFYEVRKPGSQEPEPPWFYTATMEDIQRIIITADGRTRSFRHGEEGWVFEDPPGLPVDPARWGGVTLLLSGPQARRLLAEEVEDPARYGLDRPSAVVEVQLRGRQRVRVLLGDRTPDGSAHYARQEGDPRLFLIDASWGDVLTRLVREPPYPSWFYRVPPERVFFLEVEVGGRRVAFTREGERWRFATRERTPVDPERWDREVAPLLGGPSSLRLLGRGVEDPARYGLDRPSLVVRAEYEPPRGLESEGRRAVELVVGSRLSDGSAYYARPRDPRSGEDLPFLLSVDAGWVEALTGLALSPPEARRATGGEGPSS